MEKTVGIKRVAAQVNQFRYTCNNPLLTYEQRVFYEENGFVVIRKLLDPRILEECRQRFVDICEGRAERGNMILMKDITLMKSGAKGEYLYNKVQDIIWDDVFTKYIHDDHLLDYIECFIGPNVMAIHSMLINKPPDSGAQSSQHPLHQDLHYFPMRPADKIVAAWTAMEPVNLDNGCLFVLPGTHKCALQPHDYPDAIVNKMYHGVRGFDNYPRVNVIMDVGDTVFFHPQLIHGSGVNFTKGFRKAISCHYASTDCHYIDVMGTTQENIAKEMDALVKKRGLSLTYVDLWKIRSQHCRGRPSSSL